MAVTKKNVRFHARGLQVAGILNIPEGAEEKKQNPAIVCVHPGSSCKDQTAGIIDIDIVEAVDYYTTPRGQSPNSPNKLNFTSLGSVIGFDAFHLAETLLTRPLQIIIGSKQGVFGSYKDGHELYNRANSEKKDLLVVEGASHYDLYDQPEPVKQAVEKLAGFYKENL
ncbi:alpha/beta hydrolase [Bacillus cereus]|uniref:alpha/beta hydrolase n=1 Tax=Bacillus cereus TaxID=1396 RepID=UPI0018799614|nr:alpha/beta hydrolase [Bacillus cereus]MBE7102707.1 alpha/beta hydrolase [Bacillus cereus]